MPGDAVAFILKGYPRLSETFIAQEILALERRGLDIRIFSLRRSTDPCAHPIHAKIKAPVRYLPEFPLGEAGRVVGAWWKARRRPGYGAARAAWLRDLARRPTLPRWRAFAQALTLAAELPGEVRHLHAHFLHTPASVARYAGLLTGLPWSCSAHAVDIWSTPDWDKVEKMAEMAWLTTCTRHGHDYLVKLSPAPERVGLAYHGLDFEYFTAVGARRSERDGSDPGNPVLILSVGRAVEKKGYAVLLSALARLPESLHWRFVHIGGGTLLPALKRQAAVAKNRLGTRVTWMGPLPQDRVIEQYRAADLFVLASRIAANGDRDGLPNVLMEAQSQGLACLSTRISAIPELIDDGTTGLLVAPDDAQDLSRALERLITDPGLRETLGNQGSRRVREDFSHDRWIDGLMTRFTPDDNENGTEVRP